MLTCETCGASLPASNMLMHSIRCTPSSSGSRGSSARQASVPAPVASPDAARVDVQAPAAPGSPSPSSRGERLRCRVNSDVEELQLLHEVYGWVPGRDDVRPSPAVRAQKELLLTNLDAMWASPADWVFHHVFNAPTSRNASGKRAATERPPAGVTCFKPNPYPYEVPSGTEHWVFWMASPESEWRPDSRINDAIAQAVDALGGGEFVWYPNPKMSVPDPQLYHVQVFWRPTVPQSAATT